MKGSILAIVAVAASIASAQNFGSVPTCAQPCIAAGAVAVGCTAGDVACQCSKTNEIAASSLTCLLAECTAAELITAQTSGLALCVAYSAGLSATGSATATASATTPTESADDDLTTTLSSTLTATSTVTVQTTSIPFATGVSNGTTTLVGTGSVSVTVTAKPTSTSTKAGQSTATSATVPPNAGVKMSVGLGGVGALFVAFFAL